MKKLLFTGGGGAGNEAIFRLMKDRYELHFADADLESIDPTIPDGHRHEIPFADRDEFTSSVLRLCRELKIDLLVPGVDEELLLLAEQDEVPVLLPETSYIKTMLDKFSFSRALRAAGQASPVSVLACEPWDAFPCILKPRSGRGSRNVSLLDRRAQIGAYLELTGLDPDSVIIQEYIRGQEYTVLMAADHNANLHAVVPVRVAQKRGITIRAEIDNNPDIIRFCAEIHSALPASGCYNIQLMSGGEGKILPFEINPRVSTTFCLSLAAGLDPIDIFFCDYAPRELVKAAAGTSLARNWKNHFHMGNE